MKKDFGFERRPMVDWLAPGQLAQTGIKAVISDIFGAYADKRDVMAALDSKPEIPEEHRNKEEIWIDYAADLGDGFASTYTMARLLAAERLSLRHGDTVYDLPRGQILVLGGDQVYPTASYDEYNNRMLSPYKAAFPQSPPGEKPELYALPGNHDWYDGLSNFTRIFCQQKWIGGWKTCQRRSYFAIKLPHDWWLWGIDIQLEGYIDEPQLRYFYEVGRDHVADGDRIILCTAEPSWVYGVTKKPEDFSSLRYFEDRYIRHPETHPARLAVTLTGDLHHYVRYESEDGLQRVTAGGGGAYLFATHSMPERFDLEEGFKKSTRTVHYERKGCFPDTGTSRLLTFGILRLPVQSWRFGRFLACVYALFGWILQSASRSRPDLVGPSLMGYLHGKGLESWREVLPTVGSLLGNTPMSVFLCLLVVGGFTAFCSARNGLVRFLSGAGHGAAHVLLNLALIWWLARLGVGTLGFLAGMLVLGGILGSILLALYLLLFSFVGGFHLGEAYSGQRIADYKNFLRLHLDKAGNLTIYPIGVRKIARWKPRQNPPEGEPWFELDGPAPQPELIEGPIEVP